MEATVACEGGEASPLFCPQGRLFHRGASPGPGGPLQQPPLRVASVSPLSATDLSAGSNPPQLRAAASALSAGRGSAPGSSPRRPRAHSPLVWPSSRTAVCPPTPATLLPPPLQ